MWSVEDSEDRMYFLFVCFPFLEKDYSYFLEKRNEIVVQKGEISEKYLLFPRNPSSINHFLVHGSQLELELGSIQEQLENVPMSGFSFVCHKISIQGTIHVITSAKGLGGWVGG